MIKFNEQGPITPPGVHSLTLDEFEEISTKVDNQSHRRGLFNSYKRYLYELHKIVNQPFFQLIGGSFVTRKVYPQDIDIVTFVPYILQRIMT
ncbi:DUF6932 family protein [Spirosoma aerophilum]